MGTKSDNSIAPFAPEYQLKMCKSFVNAVFYGGICSLFTAFWGCGTMVEAKRPMEGTDMKKWLAALILVCLLTGCAAAVVFSLISTRMDLEILRKLFGVLLLATGIRELCYRPKA